jgi:hypothetical protein
MTTKTDIETFLEKPWSTIARTTWILVVSLTMILYAYGLVSGLTQLQILCTQNDCHPLQLDPTQAEYNRSLGFSLDFYAWFTTIVFTIYGLIFFALAWLIFWSRYKDRMALFVSVWLVCVGAGANPVIPAMGPVFLFLFGLGFFPLLSLLPNGRFTPRWTRWLVLAWIMWAVATFDLSAASRGISGGPPDPVFQMVLLIGIGAQIYRYRYVSTPLQKQQTKWATFGFTLWFASLVSILVALRLFPELNRPGRLDFAFDRYIFTFVGLLPTLFIPAGISISILRYRLWDIDLIVRRTLVYSVLTGFLTLIYFSAVALFQAGLSAIGSQSSAVAIVITTLAIAALFSPLRRRIQDIIDRRFYRRKYDADKALADFAVAARSETDLAQLTDRLTSTVKDTLQPEGISLWMVKKFKS